MTPFGQQVGFGAAQGDHQGRIGAGRGAFGGADRGAFGGADRGAFGGANRGAFGGAAQGDHQGGIGAAQGDHQGGIRAAQGAFGGAAQGGIGAQGAFGALQRFKFGSESGEMDKLHDNSLIASCVGQMKKVIMAKKEMVVEYEVPITQTEQQNNFNFVANCDVFLFDYNSTNLQVQDLKIESIKIPSNARVFLPKVFHKSYSEDDAKTEQIKANDSEIKTLSSKISILKETKSFLERNQKSWEPKSVEELQAYLKLILETKHQVREEKQSLQDKIISLEKENEKLKANSPVHLKFSFHLDEQNNKAIENLKFSIRFTLPNDCIRSNQRFVFDDQKMTGRFDRSIAFGNIFKGCHEVDLELYLMDKIPDGKIFSHKSLLKMKDQFVTLRNGNLQLKGVQQTKSISPDLPMPSMEKKNVKLIEGQCNTFQTFLSRPIPLFLVSVPSKCTRPCSFATLNRAWITPSTIIDVYCNDEFLHEADFGSFNHHVDGKNFNLFCQIDQKVLSTIETNYSRKIDSDTESIFTGKSKIIVKSSHDTSISVPITIKVELPKNSSAQSMQFKLLSPKIKAAEDSDGDSDIEKETRSNKEDHKLVREESSKPAHLRFDKLLNVDSIQETVEFQISWKDFFSNSSYSDTHPTNGLFGSAQATNGCGNFNGINSKNAQTSVNSFNHQSPSNDFGINQVSSAFSGNAQPSPSRRGSPSAVSTSANNSAGFGNVPSSKGSGNAGFGSTGFGSTGSGSTGSGSTGSGSTGFGSTGFGSTGFGSTGFGSTGFGSTSSGLGRSGLGRSGLGSRLGSTGFGSSATLNNSSTPNTFGMVATNDIQSINTTDENGSTQPNETDNGFTQPNEAEEWIDFAQLNSS